VLHGKSKHIGIRFRFLRGLENDEIVELRYCISWDQIADVMTKLVKLEQFEKLRNMVGVTEISKIC